jgi:hypothetical protein
MSLRLASPAAIALAALPLPLALAPGQALAAAPKAPYTTTPGPARADARFVVTYSGSGSYKTRFHATPPNPGGKPDTNDAWDSSTQDWSLRFRRAAAIPTCGQPSDGSADPCEGLAGLTGASGPTGLAGRVNHRHVDGLYRQFDRSVKCRLQKRPSPRQQLDASIGMQYVPETRSIAVSASDPVATAVSLFPSQCPKQGDSIDRILDFYAMPGFSFAQGFGPERWFASAQVVIPASVFHRSAKITIPLRDTPAGTPARRCAVNDPSFERCKTGGSWSGVLTFKAQPATHAAVAAAAAKVKAPKSGQYDGGARGKDVTLFISGKSVQIMAFSFACGGGEGRTSLNDVNLKKTKKGYKFGVSAHGSVTFSDDRPDENAAVAVSGLFTRDGKRASGTFRVKAPRCHDTGSIKWKVKR